MKKKEVLKKTPFAFRSTAELFEKIVTPKFLKLKETKMIDDYYDLILCAGAVRDWLKNEFSIESTQIQKIFDNDKIYSTFHSIYNNSKHFYLTSSKGNFYVKLDAETTKIESGNSIISLDTPISLNTYIFIDSEVYGETGNLNYFCTIKNKKTGEEENWFIYEICKYCYEKLDKLIKEYYKIKK